MIKQLKDDIKIVFENTIKWLQDNVIFVINFSYLLMLFLSFSSNAYENIWLFFLMVYFVILEAFKSIIRKVRNKRMPMLKEDLTFVNEKGDISIHGDDIQKAIIYLHMIEEYIKKNNLR